MTKTQQDTEEAQLNIEKRIKLLKIGISALQAGFVTYVHENGFAAEFTHACGIRVLYSESLGVAIFIEKKFDSRGMGLDDAMQFMDNFQKCIELGDDLWDFKNKNDDILKINEIAFGV